MQNGACANFVLLGIKWSWICAGKGKVVHSERGCWVARELSSPRRRSVGQPINVVSAVTHPSKRESTDCLSPSLRGVGSTMTSPCRRSHCCTRQLWRGVTPQRLVVWHCTQPRSQSSHGMKVLPLPQQPAPETPQRLETACHCRNSWPKRRRNVRLWAEVQPTKSRLVPRPQLSRRSEPKV